MSRILHGCVLSGSEGVVEDVILLGAPVDGSEKAWERMTRVVAGKIVNGYCRSPGAPALALLWLNNNNCCKHCLIDRLLWTPPPIRGDWLLGFLYRSSAAQLSVAGLQPVNVQDRRIVNVDLSSVVSQGAAGPTEGSWSVTESDWLKAFLPTNMKRPLCG